MSLAKNFLHVVYNAKGEISVQISAIRANYTSNYNSYKRVNNHQAKPVTQPTFKSREDDEWNAGLRYLRSNTTAVYQGFNLKTLKSTINNLVAKYFCIGLNGVGMMQIANEDLPMLLGENVAKKCDLKDKIGLCVVMGEPVGEVADMEDIYEVKVFLDTPERIDQVFKAGNYSDLN